MSYLINFDRESQQLIARPAKIKQVLVVGKGHCLWAAIDDLERKLLLEGRLQQVENERLQTPPQTANESKSEVRQEEEEGGRRREEEGGGEEKEEKKNNKRRLVLSVRNRFDC
ncbi:MAG: hypothetical protein ACREBS_02245 [Nitrososphaerales archaeon]